jgi:hypothetical protein
MCSPSSGREVANQFIIEHDGARYFQSYSSIIVKIVNNITYLDDYYWNYSRTTSKYRNIFLNETTEETKKKILNNRYILTDLNKD